MKGTSFSLVSPHYRRYWHNALSNWHSDFSMRQYNPHYYGGNQLDSQYSTFLFYAFSKDPPSSVNTNSLEPNPELLAKLRDMMLKLQETRKRKAAEQEAEDPKRAKLTPMAAAVAAGKGLRDSEIEIDS